ncbi:MAG TPA: CHAT domain-containing protein [Candidatus Angelobacter sp.]|nr:CHAT domain-containing protein [Candidatus Angelobacter sp.]
MSSPSSTRLKLQAQRIRNAFSRQKGYDRTAAESAVSFSDSTDSRTGHEPAADRATTTLVKSGRSALTIAYLGPALALSLMVTCCVQLGAQEKPRALEQPRTKAKPVQLDPNKAINGILTPEQTKSFSFTISSRQYAEITVETTWLELKIWLQGPDGKEELVANRGFGDLIIVSVLAPIGGSYRLDVQRIGKRGGEGHYTISLLARKVAHPEDEKRIAAQRAFVQAGELTLDHSVHETRVRLKNYETALSLWRQVGDQRQEAVSLLLIGTLHNGQHEPDKAIWYLNRALETAQTQGLLRIEALAALNLGFTYSDRGEIQKAVPYFRQVLAASRKLGEKDLEGNALMALGRNDNSVDALEYFHSALEIAEKLENRHAEAYVLNQIGQKYIALGRIQEGMDNLQHSLEAAQAAKYRQMEAYALLHLAEGYAMEGDLRRAQSHYFQVLPLQRALDDPRSEALLLQSIGSMYMALGELNRAQEYSRQALPLWQKTQSRDQVAATLLQIGQIYSELGDTKVAFAFFQQAMSLYRTLHALAGEADALTAVGSNYRKQAKLQDARANYKRALAIYRTDAASPNMRLGEAMALKNLGSLDVSLGLTEEALKSLNRSLEILGTTGHSVDDEAGILYELARAERAANRLPDALARIDAALNLTERKRAGVAGADLRVSYVTSVRGRYEFLTALLMQLHQQHPQEGYDAKALEASEHGRARGLLDLLNESHADLRQGVDPVLLERERSLQASLTFKAAYRIRLLSKPHPGQQMSDLEKEISDIGSQYEETELQIRVHSPRYAGLTQPQPLTFAAIQGLLDSDTALLEYSLGTDKSFLWVIKTNSLGSYELPKQAEIEAVARQAYKELSINNPAGGQGATIALGRMLLGPASGQLASKRLVIVADGVLEYIPFAALHSASGAPLVEEHEIVNLPSAATLSLLRREMEGRSSAPKQIAVLADPVFSRNDKRVTSSKSNVPVAITAAERSEGVQRATNDTGMLTLDRLPATRREAHAIIAISGPDASLLALDFDANRKMATSPELGQYRIIHFASHTLLNSRAPQLSGIVLSMVDETGEPQDGFLQAHEIFNLKLHADMVVLSACETALGKEIRGEGLIGLTRAFMYAGAPRVVASLWRVPDNATSELMVAFYQKMLTDRLRPAEALRQAQLALQRENRWSAPYYWAGFVLQGEWR